MEDFVVQVVSGGLELARKQELVKQFSALVGSAWVLLSAAALNSSNYQERFAQPWLSAQLSAFLWLLSLAVAPAMMALFLAWDLLMKGAYAYSAVVQEQHKTITAKREARGLVDEQAKDAAQRGAGKLSEVAE